MNLSPTRTLSRCRPLGGRHSGLGVALLGLQTLLCGGLGGEAALAEIAEPPSLRHESLPASAVAGFALPAVDVEKLLAEDAAQAAGAGPFRFAHSVAVALDARNSGTWEDLAGGTRLWRLRLESPGAESLSLHFDRFDLPEGARLWLYDAEGATEGTTERAQVRGPFTAAEANPEGAFWTPLVLGDRLVVELEVPAGTSPEEVDLALAAVHHGYRPFRGSSASAPGGRLEVTAQAQGACNVDVACPQAALWRNQVRSVAWYTVGGIGVCTGTLMHNTAADFRPYFLTAQHCGVTASNAGSVVAYWNYESPECGQQDGGTLKDAQSGTVWRAGSAHSDFTLLEFLQPPDPEFGVYFAGWDATGAAPPAGVAGIHHPDLDEKSISFSHTRPLDEDESFWRLVWDEGTTEDGSSGSCIFDQISKLCVGTLFGGFAACDKPDGHDLYGKMNAHWNGLAASSRLSDWLDPLGTGTLTLHGADPAAPPPGSCDEAPEAACLNRGRFRVNVSWRDFRDNTGHGSVVPVTSPDSALFWFFNENNWELLVKVLDGCRINGRYWVLTAAATNVEYRITVTDSLTGQSRQYTNELGFNSPAITDTSSFAVCP